MTRVVKQLDLEARKKNEVELTFKFSKRNDQSHSRTLAVAAQILDCDWLNCLRLNVYCLCVSMCASMCPYLSQCDECVTLFIWQTSNRTVLSSLDRTDPTTIEFIHSLH